MARRRGVLATFVQMQREAERERERRARAAARSQRDAERAAAAHTRATVQDQKLRDPPVRGGPDAGGRGGHRAG